MYYVKDGYVCKVGNADPLITNLSPREAEVTATALRKELTPDLHSIVKMTMDFRGSLVGDKSFCENECWEYIRDSEYYVTLKYDRDDKSAWWHLVHVHGSTFGPCIKDVDADSRLTALHSYYVWIKLTRCHDAS